MLMKRGVTHRDEFERRTINISRVGTEWSPVALTLLEDLQRDCRQSDEPLLEELYARTSAGVGIHKMTRRGRMREVDDRLADELERRFAGPAPVVVHDMACSNAITSLDLHRTLSGRRRVILYATDYFDALWFVTPSGSRWTVVFDADGRPMQFVGRRFVISAGHREARRYPVNVALRAILMRTVLPRAATLLEAHARAADNAVASSGVRRIRLFHPLSLRAAELDADFRVGRHNLFEPSAIRSQVIRVMNALTPNHFDRKRIKAGIRSCLSSLEAGGVLVLGRSAEEHRGEPRTSAYQWDGTVLTPLWHVNGGYEWPELVDWLRCHTSGELVEV
jgi:hypothetical protein